MECSGLYKNIMNKLLIIAFVLVPHLNANFPEMYNSSHWLGTPVHLECGALTRVDCSWRYNGKTMNIGNRYRYLFSNGSATVDCTIAIGLFHEEDVGDWTCWSLSSDKFDGDLLASYTLTVKLKQHSGFMRAAPTDVSSQIGWFVNIPCKFNIILEECHWLRNGQPVAIVSRYKFVNHRASGSDCSMNITSVQNIDIGTWQCASSANNAHGYVVSRVGQLTVSEKNYPTMNVSGDGNNAIVVHPQNSTVHIGDTLILPCKFLESVRCVWLRKEQAIHVGYRYSYVTKESNSSKRTDCSLRVSNSQMIDQGQWRCVGAGDDRLPAVPSKAVFISFIRDEVAASIAEAPKDVTAPYQNNVALICRFNSTVNCDWSREGMSVKIGGRYSYASVDKGINTTDCTLQIQSVNEVDVGNWTCTSMLSYTNSYVENSHVSLSLMKTPSPAKILVHGLDMETMFVIHLEDSPALNSVDVVCLSERGNPPPGLSWRTNLGVKIPGSYEVEVVGKHLYTAKLRSNMTSFPRGRLITLRCEVDFPNVTDFMVAFIFIGEAEKQQLELVEGPKSAILPMGSTVPMNLTCKFNKPVQCMWQLNGLIEHNYKFADGSNGLNTTDCTITINPTSAMLGRWQCFSRVTPEEAQISSPKALLSLMNKPTLPVIRYYDNHVVNNSIFIYSSLLPIHLYCNSVNGNPAPNLHWELDGKTFKHFSTSIQYDRSRLLQSNEISVIVNRSLLVKNSTSMKCVLNHPSYPNPESAEVILMRNRKPLDPLVAINETLVKTNITVLTNTSTEIHCVSQGGNPAASVYWELDGQRISGVSEVISPGNNLSTVILHWPDFNWTMFRQPFVDLKCVAEHPEYEKAHVAQAVVKFVVANKPKIRDLIILNNDGAAVKAGSSFHFQCQYSESMICGMKLNDVLLDGIRFVQSVTSFDNHDLHHEIQISYITLPGFNEKDVGHWQCSCTITSDNTTVDSKPIWLSLMSSPSGPEIRWANKVVTAGMLKHQDEIPDITCVAERGNPAASLQWILDDFHVPVDNNQDIIDFGNHSYSTVLFWNTSLFMPLFHNSVKLQCVARHPNFPANYLLAEIAVTLQKAPEEPKIMFYRREVEHQPLIISMGELEYLKCICENGNPAASLTWQVNSLPVPSISTWNEKEPGFFTTELKWNSTNDRFLSTGPVLLMCFSSHPSLHNNHRAALRIILQGPGATVDYQQSGSNGHVYWVGIIISVVLLISVASAAVIYSRFRRRSASTSSQSVIQRIRRLLPWWLGGPRHSVDEPLIHYSHFGDDQGGCVTPIICDDND